MTHVDEGVIVAIRDGEVISEEDRSHVDACASCLEALDSASTRSRVIEQTLGRDELDVDVEAAKAVVRARLDAHRARPRAWGWGGQSLRRAAAILLVTAGAAYALPGSPVRDWLSRDETVGVVDAETLAGGAADAAGVSLLVSGPVEVTLGGIEEGSEVQVLWSEGSVIRVSAGPGSTYSIAAGYVGANVVEGPVRLEVPRSATDVSIAINGRMVFRGSATEAELSGVVRRSEDAIVFQAPGG